MGNNNKLFKIISMALLGLSALLGLLFMVDVVSEGLLIVWCYILLGVAVVVTLGFSIMGMAQNPKKAKSALIGVVALALVCAIAYFMSGNEVHSNIDGDILAKAGISKLSEGGILVSWFLIAFAFGAWIFAEVSKAFK